MSWAVGWDPNWYRDIGYGVPAICDQPGCDAKIDRGLAFVCGEQPYGGEHGCGLYFCHDHLLMVVGQDGMPYRCDRCYDGEGPHPAKPDVAEWSRHKLTDPSWERWRQENPAQVSALQAGVAP